MLIKRHAVLALLLILAITGVLTSQQSFATTTKLDKYFLASCWLGRTPTQAIATAGIKVGGGFTTLTFRTFGFYYFNQTVNSLVFKDPTDPNTMVTIKASGYYETPDPTSKSGFSAPRPVNMMFQATPTANNDFIVGNVIITDFKTGAVLFDKPDTDVWRITHINGETQGSAGIW